MEPILVVEDDGIIAMDLRTTLTELGYAVMGPVSSVEAALATTRGARPSLALVDIKLRGARDGIDLAQELRRDHDVPVVFLTSHSDPATLRRAAAASPLGYVLKPFTNRELEATLAVALERHRLERVIAGHERWMAGTLHALTEIVITCDADDRVVLLNPGAERLLGLTLEQGRGQTVGALLGFSPGPVPWTSAGPPEVGPLHWAGRVTPRHAPTHEFEGEVTVSTVRGLDGQVAGRVMVVRDVTTRNRTATRLAQAERLMTLATLAAGVAHEVNNPLAYVQGNVTFAVTELKRLLATPELQAVAPQVKDTIVALEECFDGTRRMSDIVGQLRLLANAGPAGQLELAPVNVARSIAAASRLARNVVLHRATLTVDAPVDLAVMANETQLVQVLTNLLANAAQAMPEDADARRDIHVSARRHTQSVIITVTDTGVGMTEAQLVRVFDPFFTTKGPTEGMGLGMSISHQHVTGMGGTIDISSRVGEGTVVRLALSLAPPEVRPASAFGARSTVPTERGRVLIIDDEPMVAGSLARLLRRSHEVETRDDPAAALRLLLEDQAWDVVLCDVMMPGLDGAQLYQRAVAAHPALRDSFAFITGGAFTPQTIELLQTTHRPVFPKPVPISELDAFIARRVSQRAASPTRPGDGSGE